MFKYNSNFTTEIEVNKYGEIIKKENEERSKFDYIISNPPYNKSTKDSHGRNNNSSIWCPFVEKACRMSDNVTMIHPGGWINGSKSDNITNLGLYYFEYFTRSEKVFPATNIAGGVTITCFRKDYKGKINFEQNGIVREYNKGMVIFENNFEEDCYNKFWNNGYKNSIDGRVKGHRSGMLAPEFGFVKTEHAKFLSKDYSNMREPIKVWASPDFGKGCKNEWWYIEKDKLNEIPEEVISSGKVIMPKVWDNPKNKKAVCVIKLSKTFVCTEKNTITSNGFAILPEEDNEYHLNLIKSYFETKTIRFLMYITAKLSQFTCGFENVPDYTYFIEELNGELFTDEFFYNKFNFSEELINHIEKVIKAK